MRLLSKLGHGLIKMSGEGQPAALDSAALKRMLIDQRASDEEVTAVLRCLDLLSNSVGMLPMRIVNRKTRALIEDHPLYDLLMYEPSPQLTAMELKKLMERRRQKEGVAFALVIRVGNRPVAIHPIEKSRMEVTQHADWTLTYRMTRPGKTTIDVPAENIIHLRDIMTDEVITQSRLRLARRAIETASDAEDAQRNMFKTGSMAKGMLAVDGTLSDKAFERLKEDIKAFEGPGAAGRLMLGEQGMKYLDFGMSGRDAQTQESRAHSIEEVARVFGVPRPLLMMDDTSWGSGIEQLATLFVRFGLAPSLFAWEQSFRRVLLTKAEKKLMDIDIDERLLLRGSMEDQAEFFAKASGSGGHKAWLHRDEIRNKTGEPPLTDEQKLEMEMDNVQT